MGMLGCRRVGGRATKREGEGRGERGKEFFVFLFIFVILTPFSYTY
jgi:hypothetical protein